jgi:hypothetical protein
LFYVLVRKLSARVRAKDPGAAPTLLERPS